VLTWWRGRAPPQARDGFYVIYDTSYRKIADVQAGNHLVGDIHEFRITPQDTALITIYRRRPADLSSVGGAKDGQIYDGSCRRSTSRRGASGSNGTASPASV
jgi:hypothetical protein